MSKLLAIETSSEACSVALAVDGRIQELHEHAPMQHAERLLPAVSRLLANAELTPQGLDAIAFGRGPGSFTSLRIGIGVVQGLAWAADLPVVPCSSLAAIAQEACDRVGASAGRLCVAVDARMHEVFTGDFARAASGIVRAAAQERVCPPSELAAPSEVPFAAAGNAFARFEDLQGIGERAVACYSDLMPRAAMVLRLALDWLTEHDPLPAALAQPIYVRDKVAEKPRSPA